MAVSINVICIVFSCFALAGCVNSKSTNVYTIDEVIPQPCNFEEINSDFNKELWKADSLGNLHYRLSYFDQDVCLLRLRKGMSKECILKYLGSPYKNNGGGLEYIIHENRMSIVLSFRDNYYTTSSITFWSDE